jgi:hypothetical protein
MPPASLSLLFTWSVESVLLGLLGLALFGYTWPILSQLILASATAAAQLALAAMQRDAYHDVAVAYLCVLTGLMTAFALRPMASLGDIMGMCFFIVTELAALGMTFASCEGATPLFLHPRGLGAALIAIALDAACWNSILGLAVGLALAAALALPWTRVALLLTAVAGVLLAVHEALAGSWARFGVAVFVVVACGVWGWLPSPKEDHSPSAPEIPTTTAVAPATMTRPMVWPKVARPVFKDL